MNRPKTLLLCCLLSLSAGACGLKGPLYLPGSEQPAPPAEPGAATGGDEEQEDEGQDGANAAHP